MFSRSSSPPGTWRPPRSPACMRTATARLGGRTRCSWPGTASPPRRGSRCRSPLIARLTWKHDKCLFLKKKKMGKTSRHFSRSRAPRPTPQRRRRVGRRPSPGCCLLIVRRPRGAPAALNTGVRAPACGLRGRPYSVLSWDKSAEESLWFRCAF